VLAGAGMAAAMAKEARPFMEFIWADYFRSAFRAMTPGATGNEPLEKAVARPAPRCPFHAGVVRTGLGPASKTRPAALQSGSIEGHTEAR
jgi:hypothetical protein